MTKGKVPSLLSASNGGISFDVVKRASACSRCKTALMQGTKVGQLKVVKAGFPNLRRICTACVRDILQKTDDELNIIRSEVA
jgi:hypothetical protein